MSFLKNTMHILVTGGEGFIGSHLVDRLIRDGHDVTVLDHFVSGSAEHKKRGSAGKRFHMHPLDLSDETAVQRLRLNGIDWVFHLAGRSSIIPSVVAPLDYHKANVTGTVNLLEACRRAGVKRFVYAASASCYGIPDRYPTPETAAIQPQYPYALTKWIGELYALHWANVYKLPVVSLRLFNVYGPRSRISTEYGPVFSTFLAQKLARKPYTVVGDGKQTRDFVNVTDVIDAFITAARSDVSGECFNVAGGKPQSINGLVRLLGGPVVHIPKRPGEPDRSHADITKIKKILGWRPKVSFEDGVAEVLRNIEYWKNAPVWTPQKIAESTAEWFKYLTATKGTS
jgi:UDP-glucose 4-epimerase